MNRDILSYSNVANRDVFFLRQERPTYKYYMQILAKMSRFLKPPFYIVRNAQSEQQAAASRSGICIASNSTPYSLTQSKQYTVDATTNVARSSSSSSSSKSSIIRTYSKDQHHTTIATVHMQSGSQPQQRTTIYTAVYSVKQTAADKSSSQLYHYYCCCCQFLQSMYQGMI